MCGIAGIWGIRDPNRQHQVIKRITDKLQHRGPDAEGFFLDGPITLGHRRLSIIDLKPSANQPMFDASGRYVLIFNGEIYNFKEVKSRIPGYPYQTDSDSEVILAAYIHWGADCVAQFNGMFAFAIWDKQLQELFIARDRLGIKPLYYHQSNGCFVFASELRAIMASGLASNQIDPLGIKTLLSYQASIAPNTVIKDIFQLMPGEYGWLREGVLTRKQYWKLGVVTPMEENADRKEVLSKVRELLFDSVRLRMIADVPLGAFLSGGIDSSAVVAIMSELSSMPVNTCSIVFEEQAFNESQYSRVVANKYHTHHHEIMLSMNDFLDELPGALSSMEHPSGDGINTYIVSKYTRKAGLTVALSGLGGDDLFAGYSTFLTWHKFKTSWKHLWSPPISMRKMAARSLNLWKNGERKYSKFGKIISSQNNSLENIYPFFRQVFLEDELEKIYPGTLNFANPVKIWLADNKSHFDSLPLLSQFTVAEISSYTQNVLIRDTDQMSMAHSLEIREPFFDYRLVEYALSIPDIIKYPHTPKQLLVEAIHPLLPEQVVNRPKMGFTFPWEIWLKQDLRSFCEQRLQRLGERPGFNKYQIDNIWKKFLSGDKSIVWSQVWILVVLEEWWKNNLDL
jgi:asparagine synthase (glutamine-hydrolysing)